MQIEILFKDANKVVNIFKLTRKLNTLFQVMETKIHFLILCIYLILNRPFINFLFQLQRKGLKCFFNEIVSSTIIHFIIKAVLLKFV